MLSHEKSNIAIKGTCESISVDIYLSLIITKAFLGIRSHDFFFQGPQSHDLYGFGNP